MSKKHDSLSMVPVSREHAAILRDILAENIKRWSKDALELDTRTAPMTNAGDVCRRWIGIARELRAELKKGA